VAGAAERRGGRRFPMALPIVLLAAGAALATAAGAETMSPRHEPQLDASVRYLQENQNLDGGFGGETGAASDPDFSAWVALALAAADINPRDQAKPGGTSVYDYLAANVGELTLTTDFERALLVVDATESPPGPFDGVNLAEKILESQLPDGGFPHEAGGADPGMNDTIFAILALSPIKEPQVEAAVQRAAGFVLAEQNGDHSWPAFCPKGVAGCSVGEEDPEDDVDMTGAAIEALNAAGLPRTEAQERALEYLHEAQLPDGGFPERLGENESNVGSTCWAVQGIWAAGGNPETWKTDAGGPTQEPLDYIASMQQPEGKIRYRASRESLGLWMTSYCAPALAGRALPIVPPPPRFEPPPEVSEGGESSTGATAGGVIAGGGGKSAPLFSRPKNQSKGKTPGGARRVHRQKKESERAPDHDRRGANHHQPNGTESAEPLLRSEADQEVETVNSATSPAAPPPARGEDGGGGNEGEGRGARGAALPAKGPSRARATTTGEEVSGIVVGSPEGGGDKLAFGAPGLKSARIGSDDQTWPAIAIGAAALLVALLGASWERGRGALV
jgi:prenyltransferase beta subunit